MNFGLSFSIPESNLNVSHKDDFILLGSCFSDEIADKMKLSGYSVLENPFGVLFHPKAIENVLRSSLRNSTEVSIYQRQDLFFSWDSSGKLFSKDKESIKTLINARRESLSERLKRANVLILTFGTAWGYKHKELDFLVGNCHKAPSNLFEKELISVNEILEGWRSLLKNLSEVNPGLKVIFTVSPVRHKKDGLIENNRSKARLIEVVHSLAGEFDNVSYFPSFEILVDELRDYRFYANDRVHPSAEAIDYIWKRFEESVFSEDSIRLSKEVIKIREGVNHKSLYPDSKADLQRLEQLKLKKEELTLAYPEICW